MHLEVWARVTALPPPVADQRVGAVARVQPLVVERQRDRNDRAQLFEVAQVEVVAVQVVQVDDVRLESGEREDRTGAGIVEELAAAPARPQVAERMRRAQRAPN